LIMCTRNKMKLLKVTLRTKSPKLDSENTASVELFYLFLICFYEFLLKSDRPTAFRNVLIQNRIRLQAIFCSSPLLFQNNFNMENFMFK
jgi:hypothetical protein